MKKIILSFVLFCLSVAFFSQQVKNSKSEVSEKLNFVPQYKIGDEGEGGGIVFYVSQEGFVVYDGMGGEKLCHYLEMSKSTLDFSGWSPATGHANTSTGIGYGKFNTKKILNYYEEFNLTEESCAAYRCSVYSTEKAAAGEWFLPSRDELNEMYKAMSGTVVSDATYNEFWSSSDLNNLFACAQNFSDGELFAGDKGWRWYSVRAVRAF